MPNGGALEGGCVDLFLSSRMQRHLLTYLAVQEGADTRPGAEDMQPLERVLKTYLFRLGRNGMVRFVLRRRGRTLFSIDPDPFRNLRRIHARALLAKRRGRLGAVDTIGNAADCCAFWLKFGLLRLALRFYRRRLERYFVGPGGAAGTNLVRHATNLLRLIFAGTPAARFDPTEIAALIEPWLGTRLERLQHAVSVESLMGSGLGKLAKIAFGVLVGRAVALRHAALPESEATRYVVESIHLAYCWGITYPLADDVLDSANTDAVLRAELLAVLARVFAPGTGAPSPPALAQDRGVAELETGLTEMLALVTPERRETAKAVFRHLCEAHRRDSDRRLAQLDASDAPDPHDVLANSLLKAALVRIATMHVCGLPIGAAEVTEALRMGLLNQLGDDIWDREEDEAAGRLTPVTYFARRPETALDPYALYIDYAAFLGRDRNPPAVQALFMGVAETLRLGAEAGGCAPAPLLQALERLLPPEDRVTLLRAMPHVDLDAVVFRLEAGLRPLLHFEWIVQGHGSP